MGRLCTLNRDLWSYNSQLWSLEKQFQNIEKNNGTLESDAVLQAARSAVSRKYWNMVDDFVTALDELDSIPADGRISLKISDEDIRLRANHILSEAGLQNKQSLTENISYFMRSAADYYYCNKMIDKLISLDVMKPEENGSALWAVKSLPPGYEEAIVRIKTKTVAGKPFANTYGLRQRIEQAVREKVAKIKGGSSDDGRIANAFVAGGLGVAKAFNIAAETAAIIGTIEIAAFILLGVAGSSPASFNPNLQILSPLVKDDRDLILKVPFRMYDSNELPPTDERVYKLDEVERAEYDRLGKISPTEANTYLRRRLEVKYHDEVITADKKKKDESGKHVHIVGMELRDGLQNEKNTLTTEEKLDFISRLTWAGQRQIEIGSFVHPKVLAMRDTDELFNSLNRSPGVRYVALTPNERGLDRAMAAKVPTIAIFTGVSEEFENRNLGRSIEQSLRVYAGMVPTALSNGMEVRGYASMVWGSPHGDIPAVDNVYLVVERLLGLGCYEVSLGDTIGKANPDTTRFMIEGLLRMGVPEKSLAVHFHDTYGRAVENILAAIELGVKIVDASAGGLGGCPFCGVPDAPGNVATEKVVEALMNHGIDTGLNLEQIRQIGRDMREALKKVKD